MRRARPAPPPRGGAFPRRGAPAREGASWAGLPLAAAATAFALGLLILAASFTGENVLGGGAGRFWARVFAGAGLLTGLFLALLALGLSGEGTDAPRRHAVPAAAGAAAGLLTGALLLDGAAREAALAPLLLLLFALPPVRDGLSRLAGRLAGRGAPGR